MKDRAVGVGLAGHFRDQRPQLGVQDLGLLIHQQLDSHARLLALSRWGPR